MILAIDLGTTNSAMSILDEYGKPIIIPNAEGEQITPSILFFEGREIVVGTIAKNALLSDPENSVQFIKRQMGTNFVFTSESGENYRPEELSALILRKLKNDAEVYLNKKIEKCLITVPAYFNDAQRKATIDAGTVAGMEVVSVINEPTAGALAYGVLRQQEKAQRVLVYDLGGGTFDVTLLKIENEEIQVIATDGDKNLGGFDYDNALMNFLNQEFMESGGKNLLDDPISEAELRAKAEIAKKSLSQREKTKLFLAHQDKSLAMTLSYEKFEELTLLLTERTLDLCQAVLEETNIPWNEIDEVLLIGGSTRMKTVVMALEKLSGKKLKQNINPDEAVALGASIFTTLFNKKNHDLPIKKVVDVSAHSMGIVAQSGSNEVNVIVLKKNTSLPTEVSEIFQTVCDNQTHLNVQVTQGEDKDLGYITIVGEAIIKIPPYPKSSPVEVTFQYNTDSLVMVKVFDKVAHQFLGEIKIERKNNLTSDGLTLAEQKVNALQVS